jgi:FKBP-type peptidyl-prolyl cis-trans isomerase FklB
MKKHTPRLLFLASSLGALCVAPMLAVAQSAPLSEAAPSVAAPAAAAPTADEAGYAYGVNFGYQLHQLGITTEIPMDSLARGMKDGMAGKKTTSADIKTVMGFVKSVNDETLARNHAAAKEFLAHNAAEKGVKKTQSGLQYKIIAAGNAKAASPHPADTVTVQYRGKLIDGTEFDSSFAHGTPSKFAVGGVIKGWQEALALMKPGAKWQLFIPPELGYDAALRPGIPAGSLLIFDVELLNVASPSETKPTADTSAPANPVANQPTATQAKSQ